MWRLLKNQYLIFVSITWGVACITAHFVGSSKVRNPRRNDRILRIKKKFLHQKRFFLESKSATVESRLINCLEKDRNAILNSINNTQNELNHLIAHKAKGAAIRSRARWTEHENNKHFLRLEKRIETKKQLLEKCAKYFDKCTK